MALLCESVQINTDALGVEDLELPNNITVQFSNMIPGENDGYHYMSVQAEVVLTFNNKTNVLFGHVSTEDGRSYVIEDCGQEGHVFKEIDVSKLGEDVGIAVNSTEHADKLDFTNSSNRQGQISTYSVKVYYTPEFAASTSNVHRHIDRVITVTNQGYMNSRVNLRVKLHCIEMATLHDIPNARKLLDDFTVMKGSWERVRGSADAAVLFTDSLGDVCGIGWVDSMKRGRTFSVVQKYCEYTFGHELGHNIGLEHNKEYDTDKIVKPYAYGHLIAPGDGQRPKYYTIMSYARKGHYKQVNYYSNPRINLPMTGTPLGVEEEADSARLLNERRAKIAGVGDESESC